MNATCGDDSIVADATRKHLRLACVPALKDRATVKCRSAAETLEESEVQTGQKSALLRSTCMHKPLLNYPTQVGWPQSQTMI